MLNLFTSKAQKNKKGETPRSATDGDAETLTNRERPVRTPMSSAQIRVQKDILDIESCETYRIVHADPDDLMNFKVIISPNEGFYAGGVYEFKFTLTNDYPHSPPKVKCETDIFHPNIDVSGNVCLNILREDWRPVLSLNAVILGIYHIFLEPNPEDPLNKEAGDVLRNYPNRFADLVTNSIDKVRSQQRPRQQDGRRRRMA